MVRSVRRPRFATAALAVVTMTLNGGRTAGAVDNHAVAFLHEPAIGSGRIVFVSAGDLWTVEPVGSLVAFTGKSRTRSVLDFASGVSNRVIHAEKDRDGETVREGLSSRHDTARVTHTTTATRHTEPPRMRLRSRHFSWGAFR
jgi:hypothetical protein